MHDPNGYRDPCTGFWRSGEYIDGWNSYDDPLPEGSHPDYRKGWLDAQEEEDSWIRGQILAM